MRAGTGRAAVKTKIKNLRLAHAGGDRSAAQTSGAGCGGTTVSKKLARIDMCKLVSLRN